MKRHNLLFAIILIMLMALLTSCGGSNTDSAQTESEQVQEETVEVEESAEPNTAYEYVAEDGKFTQNAGVVLENIDKRMEGVCVFHILQEGPSVFIRWTEDQEISTAISCNKSDGETPVDSSEDIPGGIFLGTYQPAGELSEYAVDAIVYTMQTLNSDLAEDKRLKESINEMADEALEMKANIGDGGLSERTIGGFDVKLLLQESDGKLSTIFIINQQQ